MGAKKISRTILNIQKNLILKLHVKLVTEDNGELYSFHNEFDYQGSQYIRIDNMPFMTLDIVDKEQGWDKSNSIMITPMNIVHIVKAMERMLDAIYGDDVFAINSQNKIVIYKDMVEKHTEKLFNIGLNQRLVIKPAILLDHNDVEVEGVVFYFNKPDNVVEVSIDAFESLVYTLKKVDLFAYSQLLINYYMIYRKNRSTNTDNTRYEKKINIPTKRDVFNKDFCSVQGNVNRSADDFDGLGKN